MRDDKAQMMVLEAIFFAITVVIALILLFQMSPTSIQSGSQSSNNLKMLGDNALDAIYAETQHIKQNVGASYTTNNPSSKLVVSIIKNDYSKLTDSLNNILPDSVIYNIYISNGSKTVFWCTSTGDPNEPLTMLDPVAISHHQISIDPIHLAGEQVGFDGLVYENGEYSKIAIEFLGDPEPTPPYYPDPDSYEYQGATYEVILEMSFIWVS
jgi:hypothetical protein